MTSINFIGFGNFMVILVITILFGNFGNYQNMDALVISLPKQETGVGRGRLREIRYWYYNKILVL